MNSSYVSPLGPVTGDMPAVKTRTSSWEAGYGRGRSNTQSTTEKTAALSPMPIASDNAAVAVATGWRRNIRTAYIASRRASSSQRNARASRCRSFVCSMPPSASRAERRASPADSPRRRYSSSSNKRCEAISRSSPASSRPGRMTLMSRRRNRLRLPISRPRSSGRCGGVLH